MGSIPIVGTIFVKYYRNAPVAELADAPDLGSGTSVWGFKSLQAHHFLEKSRFDRNIRPFFIQFCGLKSHRSTIVKYIFRVYG